MKECGKCKIISENFYKDKRSKDGFRSTCKVCDSITKKMYMENNSDKIKIVRKERYKKDIEKIKIYGKQYYENNKEKIYDNKKDYYENNKEEILTYKRQYYIDNKEIISIKKSNYFKYKMENDILYNLKYRIKSLIYLSFYNKGFTKKSRTYKILCCSFDDFKLYIESKFEPWMTWENRGLYNGELNYGWDIDHIIPISSAKTEDEIIKLNHYTNLRPLCSKVNRDIKKAKIQKTS